MDALIEPRVENLKVINQIREEAELRCTYVDPAIGEDCGKPAEGEPHHIRTRGAGGSDIRENLIQLCGEHHRMFHDGNLDRNILIQIVAKREGKEPGEIADILKLSYEEPPPPTVQPKIEELLHAYIQVDEGEQEARFIKGQLLDSMIAAGATQKYLSSQIGVSPAQIRELVYVYRAFPDRTLRNPALSWYHHRVASRSSDPHKHLALASDQHLSIRDMRKEILQAEGSGNLVEEDEKAQERKLSKYLTEIKTILNESTPLSRWLENELKRLIGGEDSDP